jgi:hypothetical protein
MSLKFFKQKKLEETVGFRLKFSIVGVDALEVGAFSSTDDEV